jgi:hypothetical protein
MSKVLDVINAPGYSGDKWTALREYETERGGIGVYQYQSEEGPIFIFLVVDGKALPLKASRLVNLAIEEVEKLAQFAGATLL